MSIFADKHFSSGMAGIYHFAIQLAIILRAMASLSHRFLQQIWQPVLDVVVIWIGILFIIFLSGGYDKPLKTSNLIKGLLIGTVLIAALYGFLPESLRFSRAIIVLGAIWSMFTLVSWRYLLNFIFPSAVPFFSNQLKRVAIAGTATEATRVQTLLNQVGIQYDYVGNILPSTVQTNHPKSIGHLNEVR